MRDGFYLYHKKDNEVTDVELSPEEFEVVQVMVKAVLDSPISLIKAGEVVGIVKL